MNCVYAFFIFYFYILFLLSICFFSKIIVRVNINISPKPENALMMQHLHCTIYYQWSSMENVAFSSSYFFLKVNLSSHLFNTIYSIIQIMISSGLGGNHVKPAQASTSELFLECTESFLQTEDKNSFSLLTLQESQESLERWGWNQFLFCIIYFE